MTMPGGGDQTKKSLGFRITILSDIPVEALGSRLRGGG